MKYFNTFEIIRDMMAKEYDYKSHLQKITKETVLDDLFRRGKKIPMEKGFLIKKETMEEENWAKLPSKVKNSLIEMSSLSNPNENHLNSLLDYQKLYPNVPAIYNFISVTYYKLEQKTEQYETILATISKFPNYLFGKIELANYYKQNDMLNKINLAYDNKMEIYDCAPRDNNMYHISEVRNFYHNVGYYYTYKNKTAEALLCYFLLLGLDEKHFYTENLGKFIVINEVDKMYRKKSKKK